MPRNGTGVIVISPTRELAMQVGCKGSLSDAWRWVCKARCLTVVSALQYVGSHVVACPWTRVVLQASKCGVQNGLSVYGRVFGVLMLLPRPLLK